MKSFTTSVDLDRKDMIFEKTKLKIQEAIKKNTNLVKLKDLN